MFTIKETTADSLIALRWQVLRPGRPESAAHFAEDAAEGSAHFAALDINGVVIGCASVIKKNNALQLRGMATAPEWQGKGVGSAVLAATQAYALRQGLLLWCNARVSAVGFYQKSGWHTEGEPFDVAESGPHVVMRFSSESC
ncbi:GNAT family N-acetyltransferase [Armatimonas sp.]|uniref:GNAT family N-acetyltransferase n=1 Tax=Armatimonas sp. TaxID=1872638 RepID=UPI003752408A